jgi:DNA segregation ATPase FtsK/SpoIIIE-like protein
VSNAVKYFWSWNGGPADSVLPFFLGWLPMPFFRPIDGNIIEWLLCILVGVLWALVGSVMLNIIVERGVTCERIEEKWRRACLHVGLVTSTNLIPDEDVKEFPPVVTVTPKTFVIQSKGFTPEHIQEKRIELSGAMGLFIGDVGFLKKADGSTFVDLLELTFSMNDLPAMVPLRNVPVAGAGKVVLGLGMQGYHTVSLEEMIHLGVAGEPGSGKSVCLRGLITQLMVTNRDAVIVGIDFKGGAEFSFFEGLGNFVCIDEYDGAANALRNVFDEYKRRVALVRASECDSVYQLSESIPPIVIIIDEAAEFWQSEKGVSRVVLQDALGYVDKLARLGRFAAIHLVICTQRASANVIPPEVRSMLTTRVIFKVSQKEDSIMFISTAAATKLRKVAGRFYLRAPDGNLKELQAPYVSKAEAKEILLKQLAPASSELVDMLRQNVWKMRLAA